MLLATDLGVVHAMRPLGLDPGDDHSRFGSWAPWRSYATHHLWGSLAPTEPHDTDPPDTGPSDTDERTRR